MEAMDTLKREIARLLAAKEARRHKLAARPFPEKGQSRGTPPRDGCSRAARARHKSARMEDRRARGLIHALTLTLSRRARETY